jgi:hypothetical protein
VSVDVLGSHPPERCQAIGGGAAWLHRDGLLVPSARASGWNLVAFVDQMDPDAAMTVVDRTDLAHE